MYNGPLRYLQEKGRISDLLRVVRPKLDEPEKPHGLPSAPPKRPIFCTPGRRRVFTCFWAHSLIHPSAARASHHARLCDFWIIRNIGHSFSPLPGACFCKHFAPDEPDNSQTMATFTTPRRKAVTFSSSSDHSVLSNPIRPLILPTYTESPSRVPLAVVDNAGPTSPGFPEP